MKNVILDCDGVLLNWRDSFNQWLHGFGLVDNINSWDYSKYSFADVLTVDKSLEIPLMKMYNQTHHISSLPPIAGAVEALKLLHSEGHSLKVVTSFSTDYKSLRMREDNLIKVFGDIFQDITALSLRGNKTDYLAAQPKDSYFVEDYIPNILCGIDAGLSPDNMFIIPHPYNVGEDFEKNKDNLKGVRFGDWDLVRKHILYY